MSERCGGHLVRAGADGEGAHRRPAARRRRWRRWWSSCVIGALFDEAIVGFVADLLRGLEALPTWLVTGVVLVGQVLGVVVIVGGAVVAVVQRRWFLLGVDGGGGRRPRCCSPCCSGRIVDDIEPQVADVDGSYTLVPADRVASTVGLAMLAAVVTAAGARGSPVGGGAPAGPW